jgi:hypothetical protein
MTMTWWCLFEVSCETKLWLSTPTEKNTLGSIFRLTYGQLSPALWRNYLSTRGKKQNASKKWINLNRWETFRTILYRWRIWTTMSAYQEWHGERRYTSDSMEKSWIEYHFWRLHPATMQNTNYYSNKSATHIRDACKESTSRTITNLKAKRTIRGCVTMWVMIRGLKEQRIWE